LSLLRYNIALGIPTPKHSTPLDFHVLPVLQLLLSHFTSVLIKLVQWLIWMSNF